MFPVKPLSLVQCTPTTYKYSLGRVELSSTMDADVEAWTHSVHVQRFINVVVSVCKLTHCEHIAQQGDDWRKKKKTWIKTWFLFSYLIIKLPLSQIKKDTLELVAILKKKDFTFMLCFSSNIVYLVTFAWLNDHASDKTLFVTSFHNIAKPARGDTFWSLCVIVTSNRSWGDTEQEVKSPDST